MIKSIHVIDASIPYDKYVPIDLSVHNPALKAIDLADANAVEQYVEAHVQSNNATIAYGGYDEQRNLYRTSALFDNTALPRDIHIGTDIWAPAGTQVLAAISGVVHSFSNNRGIGNYGPTIILQHESNSIAEYSLYGHLSVESIASITIGEKIAQGQVIATLGNASVNGGYAPHLHFQLIKNIGEYKGDYPGVCSSTDREYYLENCPNPNLLLNIL